MENSFIKIEKLENSEVKFETNNLTPIEILGLLTLYKNIIQKDLSKNSKNKKESI